MTNDVAVDVVNARTITNTTPNRAAEGTGGAFVTLRKGNVVSAGPGIVATNDSGYGASDGAIGDAGITIEGGTISAPNGPAAQAIQGEFGAGDAYVRMSGGQVTAHEGLDAQNNGGLAGNALTELSGGTVTTDGFGLRAFIENSQGTGDATTNMSGGSVSTSAEYPIMACEEKKSRPALIQCLSPNRRVEVRVSAF